MSGDTTCLAPAPARRGRPSAQTSAAISATILSAATHSFLQEGYDGTTMEAVAARAGIPKTTLYKRYADKNALLLAVLHARVEEWSRQAVQQQMVLSEDLEERLREYTATMLIWATTPEVRSFTRLAMVAAERPDAPPSYREMLGYMDMVDLVTRDICALAPATGIRPRAPEKVAFAMMDLIAGWLDRYASPEPMSLDEAKAQADFIVTLLFRGIAAW